VAGSAHAGVPEGVAGVGTTGDSFRRAGAWGMRRVTQGN
jgi:hypothetical protein